MEGSKGPCGNRTMYPRGSEKFKAIPALRNRPLLSDFVAFDVAWNSDRHFRDSQSSPPPWLEADNSFQATIIGHRSPKCSTIRGSTYRSPGSVRRLGLHIIGRAASPGTGVAGSTGSVHLRRREGV